MEQNLKTNTWIEEFDERFGEVTEEYESYSSYNGVGYKNISKDIKSFISTLLAQRQKELVEIVKNTEVKVIDKQFLNKDVIEFYKTVVEETKRVILEALLTPKE